MKKFLILPLIFFVVLTFFACSNNKQTIFIENSQNDTLINNTTENKVNISNTNSNQEFEKIKSPSDSSQSTTDETNCEEIENIIENSENNKVENSEDNSEDNSQDISEDNSDNEQNIDVENEDIFDLKFESKIQENCEYNFEKCEINLKFNENLDNFIKFKVFIIKNNEIFNEQILKVEINNSNCELNFNHNNVYVQIQNKCEFEITISNIEYNISKTIKVFVV